MVENIMSKDSEACRAGSLGEMEKLRIVKVGITQSYTEEAQSYTERIRKTINR